MRQFKIILFVWFCMNVKLAYTQVDTLNHKLCFYVSGGMAIPFGEFAHYKSRSKQKGYSNPAIAGPASIGYNGKTGVTYLFSSKVGATLCFYTSSNKASIVSEKDLFPEKTSGLGGGTVITSYQYNTKSWKTNAIFTGIFIRIFNSRFWGSNIKINVGVQQVKSPETTLAYQGYNWQMNWTTTQPYTASTFQPELISYNAVLNPGVDLEFHLGSWSIVADADFYLSQARFKGDEIAEYNNGTSQSYSGQKYPVEFIKNIYLFCANIGVSYAIK